MAHTLPDRLPGTRSFAGTPELTIRALLTGLLLGALLTPCNVYSGLKIGWSFNMSIAAGLLAVGFWRLMERAAGTRRLDLLENNINQTTASSSASIISGGLVAPIPAWTLLTGQTLPFGLLALWVFGVSILGVAVAAGIRQQMIERERLAFPMGLATAETMTQIHSLAKGASREAMARLQWLGAAAALSGGVKLVVDLVLTIPRLAFPGALGGAPLKSLGFAFDPSLLMIGFGAIIGLRVGISLLVGALLSWGVLAPFVLAQGWAEAGPAGGVWYEPLVTWLLWPGVTLIVVSVLVSFTLSVVSLWWRARRARIEREILEGQGASGGLGVRVSGLQIGVFLGLASFVSLLAFALFGVGLTEGLLAVALSWVLAVVAARVTGETGVTPIGALGKVTQLTFGAVSPANVTANLMTANITGGAAGQCADLLQDLKTGHLIGATPRLQIMAQCFGILSGSLVGTLVYLVLIPDPQTQLLTEEWPAPAVATWKAVAEVLSVGLSEIPTGAVPAMGIAAVLGVFAAILERTMPAERRHFLPSAPAFGLAFVLPAWNSISLFIGAALAALLARYAPAFAEKRTIAIAAGLVAGESLIGVGLAFATLFSAG